LASQGARDLIENVRHGNVSGMSIGMLVVKEEWRKAGDRLTRSLIDINLIEISPVTFPAYEGTSIVEA
jgi:HK97 family phage prohead protease